MRHLPVVFVLLSYAWLLATALLGGLGYPGYSHVAQYISELGAQGAPHGRLVSTLGLIPAGVLLVIGCALAAWQSAVRDASVMLGLLGLAWYGLGLLVGGAMPYDALCRPENPSLSQIVHDLVAGSGYLMLALSAFVLGATFLRLQRARGLAVLAFIAGAATVLLLPALHPDSTWAGLAQRLIEVCNALWVVPAIAMLCRRPGSPLLPRRGAEVRS